jgi:hypothetical protein
MTAEMRSMREGLQRVMHRLSPHGVSANASFEGITVLGEGNDPINVSINTPPDTMGGGSITQSSTTELVSSGDTFNVDFPFDASQTSLPANGLSEAASEAASGDDEVSKRRRLSGNHDRVKSCTQCRLHKVRYPFFSSTKGRLTLMFS